MLSEDEMTELTELRARAYGGGTGPAVTSADLARLHELETSRRSPTPIARVAPVVDVDAAATTDEPPASVTDTDATPAARGPRRPLVVAAITGLLLAMTAFVSGLSAAEFWSEQDGPESSMYFGSYSDEAGRSFERVTRYINWDDPAMLASMYSGDDLTVWAGTTGEGAQNCAAFDSGGEVVLKCLSSDEDEYPHVFGWTNPSGPDAGDVTITIQDDGGMTASYESATG